MEYFDFEGASHGSHGSHGQDDDVASDHIEMDENEAMVNFDALLQDQPLEFPNEDPHHNAAATGQQEGQGPEEPVVDPLMDIGMFPMAPAKDPCDFCRRMGLDCFVATRGVMQNGCTCCISLYRECSFTHTKAPGKFLDTLHTVSENVDIPTGGLTGKRALKSLTGVAAPEDAEARDKKNSSTRLARNAVRILKTWLLEHRQYPYPNEQEKEELMDRTGLKKTQVSNWLANARRRSKIRSPSASSQGGVDIPGQDSGQESDTSLMTPMERWKHSPPENEPAATSDILRALMNAPFDPSKPRPQQFMGQGQGHGRSLSRAGSSNKDSSHAHSSRQPSISSHETSRSSLSDFSFASAFSHRSMGSGSGSFGSKERKTRRRRRKSSAPVNTFTQQRAQSGRIFQCTFCAESFPTKYDWQRHEKSLHLALEHWTCSPEGGATIIDGIRRCVFCMAEDPDPDHLESAHDYSSCHEKMPHERSFHRKDHLNQHLRLIHQAKFHPSTMERWRSATTEIKSRCGFCNANFVTWKDRIEHLAAHFKNGADMCQWQGDWGFEPFVLNLVENAMPPYMIGHEKNTVNPFKPSHNLGPMAMNDSTASSLGFVTALDTVEDTNAYRNLQQSLTVYIHNQLVGGVVPTDHMLQAEARRIIFGSDDSWNQTCADNPTWLDRLKRDNGLFSHPPLDNNNNNNPLDNDNPSTQFPSPFPLPGNNTLGPHSGTHSPAPRTGRSSAAASGPGSSSGSFNGGGSSGGALHTALSGLSTDWSGNGSSSSFSTPVSASFSADPFVQMGFDPGFLQQLSHGAGFEGGEAGLHDDMDVCWAAGDAGVGGQVDSSGVDKTQMGPGSGLGSGPGPVPLSVPGPIQIPSPKDGPGSAPGPGVSGLHDMYGQ